MKVIQHTTKKLYIVSSFSQDVLKAHPLPPPSLVWGRMSCSRNILLPENRPQLDSMFTRGAGEDPRDLVIFLERLDPDRIFWGFDEWREVEEYNLVHDSIPVEKLIFTEYHRRLAQFVFRTTFEHDMGIPHSFAWELINRLSDAADLNWVARQNSLPPIAGPVSPWEQAVAACGT